MGKKFMKVCEELGEVEKWAWLQYITALEDVSITQKGALKPINKTWVVYQRAKKKKKKKSRSSKTKVYGRIN